MGHPLAPTEMIAGAKKMARYLAFGGMQFVNLEVTLRCNAKCDFCPYWHTKAESKLDSYVPILKKFDPMYVGITGGEPLLRKDITKIIRDIRENLDFIWIGLITHGQLLTVDKAVEMEQAGLDELAISLDYMDERHDKVRGIPGLFHHIADVAPKLAARGMDVKFNSIIMRENFREMPAFARKAAEWGVRVSFTCYNEWKVGNVDHRVQAEEMHELREVLRELKHLKRTLGNISSSEHYLDRMPEFFERRAIGGCTAGLNWLQITPDGYIRRCPDLPIEGHWTQIERHHFRKTDCTKCWYACRADGQQPMTPRRILNEARGVL
ncbi:MAG: radical SAM protein [Planctomycetes bacterium]|nr:radical SAM protein [Planctomycetota bacterium]